MGNQESYQTLLIGHICSLSGDPYGLPKFPPNASFISRLIRAYKRLLAPNPNLSISKRNFRNVSQMTAEVRRHAQSKYFYIIHPYSTLELIRQLLFILIGFWEILGTATIACFSWVKDADEIYQPEIFRTGKKVFVFMECIWILSCLQAGYKSKNTIVIEHPKIIMWYALTYLIPDCLTLVLPLGNLPDYLYFLNFIIAVRCGTLITYLQRVLEDLKVCLEIRQMTIIVIGSLLVVHAMTLLFFLLPEMLNHGNEMLWIWKEGYNNKFPIHIRYASCFLLIGHTFLGWPDEGKPDSMWELLVLGITMIFGRLWMSLVLAALIRMLSITSLSESKYEGYLKQLETFITQSELPKEMHERILKFYVHKYQRHIFDEKQIFTALSKQLRERLMLYGARRIISTVAVFKSLPISTAARIISRCKILVYLNNDFIIKTGERKELIYFISSGVVAVYTADGKYELLHLADGEDLGIGALSKKDPGKFKYNFISVGTTEIYVIHRNLFRDIVSAEIDIFEFVELRQEARKVFWANLEKTARSEGVDLTTELRYNRILEKPRVRTRYYEE